MTGTASAEPIETWALVACVPNDNLICNVEYDLPSISITMDVYMPPAGQTYPAVILIHGGGWESGDKRSEFMIDRATYLTSRGLVAVAINYRLTCDPPAPESVADADLCVGNGHGTVGTVTEAVDDAQEAMEHIGDNAAGFRIDATKGIGALGISAGGLLAADLALKGAEGGVRADAAVTWSGAMHLEHINAGYDRPHLSRKRLVGCWYSGQGACSQGASGWDAYSPQHSCCDTGNLTAQSPLLMFNSHDELVERQEPDDMYTLVSGTAEIPVTKVILRNAGHAYYPERQIDLSRGDTIDSDNYPTTPGIPQLELQTVEEASAYFFLTYLCLDACS